MAKKVLIGIGLFLVVVIIALAAAPAIFKDEINQALDEQLDANINAEVIYDLDNFSLTFFRNFPNLTASITDLKIVGRELFAGKTLFQVKDFAVEISLWKLLGSEISVQGIYLDQPGIFIKVLADGTANYDIAVSVDDSEETADTVEVSDFNLAIEYWQITDGHLIYDDATLPTYVELTRFNHSGGGNFSLSVFDLTTSSEAYLKSLSYDGDHYLEGRSINLDMVLNMDLDKMKFTFKENSAAINDFSFGFDGWLAMPADDIDMNLSFSTQENSFKSLISLIPSMYASDFDELETSGSLAFNGTVKGTYNETSMPAYDISLLVNDGMFHYPELPESVNNVQLAMNIVSHDGNVDNTAIDVSKFHLEFGKEPMDGHLKLGNLVTYPIDLEFNTSINLANLNQLLPMPGLEIKGVLQAEIEAVGTYDSIAGTIPRIDAKAHFKNGAINYTAVPTPIENINIEATMSNKTGKLDDTRFAIPEFAMAFGGSQLSGELLADKFDNLHWQTSLNGDINFDVLFPIINHLYPLPGMSLSGNIKTNFNSEGTMQDVEQENYRALKTSGGASFDNFVYTDSVYLPQGFRMESGALSFDSRRIEVVELQTSTGSSDFKFNGTVSNYLDYLFYDEEIKGELVMTSRRIDVNEFMTESGAEEEAVEEAEYGIIEVPENIDFVFDAAIGQIRYDEMLLDEARGRIVVKDAQLRLNDLFTKTLGGAITFDGFYNTQDLNKPKFAMDLDVKEVGILEAYKAFDVVKALAPIAKDVSGKASSLFSLRGVLKEDMMPEMATLTGKGLVNIAEASLEDSKFVSGLTDFIKGGNQSLTLKDIKMNVSIEDGKLKVQPFDLKLNNTSANIGGTTGLDGSIDYKIRMEVPAGQLGAQVNSLLGAVTGNQNTSEAVALNIGVGGSYNQPNFKLLATDGQSMTDVARQNAGDLLEQKTGVDVPVSKEELNKEAMERARTEADKLLADAQVQADKVKSEAKIQADKLRAEAKKQSDKLIAEAGSNLIKKKGAEIAGKKLIDEAELQAQKLEAEGDKQAEAIMAKAREKAEALVKAAENK